nr:uncharacterized protein LOC116774984 [Danaus plexippus plexippus]
MYKPAGGRPVTTSTDKIKGYIELHRHMASRDIAQEMEISHQTISNHLQKGGYKKDNARQHTSLMTRQKLQELGWEVLSHPPYYSPDIAPSDYQLFLSMANALDGVKLNSKEVCEKWLSNSSQIRKGASTRGVL